MPKARTDPDAYAPGLAYAKVEQRPAQDLTQPVTERYA
jgi:hypothetical protein